jgi:hypothetical protein
LRNRPSARADVTRCDVDVEGIGFIGIEIDERPAGDVQGEGLTIERALPLDAEGFRILAGRLLACLDRSTHFEVQHFVVDDELAILHEKIAHDRQFRWPACRGIARARVFESPVRASRGLAMQIDFRMDKLDARQDHIALQERQPFELRVQSLDTHHRTLACVPRRIADREIGERDVRRR